MKSFKADILSISPSDKGLTLKTSWWPIYVINSVDNSKIPSYRINWSNLKSRHNLQVPSVYLPQMKVLLFCTGHNSQVHDVSCTICTCDDRVIIT